MDFFPTHHSETTLTLSEIAEHLKPINAKDWVVSLINALQKDM